MKAFEKLGFRGTTFDVATGGDSEDFSTKTGFETALFKSLRLLERGLVMCQPPCSLFIFFSSSQHQRSTWGPRGATWDDKVFLANLLAVNMASRIFLSKFSYF